MKTQITKLTVFVSSLVIFNYCKSMDESTFGSISSQIESLIFGVDNRKYCTTKTSIDENGNKIYEGVYPFENDKGFLAITDRSDYWKNSKYYPEVLYPEDCKNATVKIERHAANAVIIKALLKKDMVKLLDESLHPAERRAWHDLHQPRNDYQEYDWIWTPWYDDCIHKDYFKAKRNDILRGGNRLTLQLREPANYSITLPADANFESRLSKDTLLENNFETQLTTIVNGIFLSNNKLNDKYQLTREKGLVQIKGLTQNYLDLQITRHKENSVIIDATFEQNISDSNNQLNAWDCEKSGGNRITLNLQQPGHYSITVPADADLETNLSDESKGKILYSSNEPTKLTVECKRVNRWGDSGSSTPESENWQYYWGREEDPVTRLITKKGEINL